MITKRLISLEDPLFCKLWELYNSSFPIYERRDIVHQREALLDERCEFEYYLIGEDLLGFLISWQFKNMIYIEHFAVNPVYRNQGMGSVLLEKFIEKHSNKCILLEIDPTEDEISRRREQFYIKKGFVRNDHKHIHPPYNNPLGDQYELIIMTYGETIADKQFQEFVTFQQQDIVKYV